MNLLSVITYRQQTAVYDKIACTEMPTGGQFNLPCGTLTER